MKLKTVSWKFIVLFFKAFGVSKEEFDSYIANGIILWGPTVHDALEEGQLRIRQTTKSEMTPLVSILIEGKKGKEEIVWI
jgi:hypothetical protein